MKPDPPNPKMIGPLSYHSGLDGFAGNVVVGNAQVYVRIDMNAQVAPDLLVHTGESFLRELDSLQKAATDHVCRHMLDLKNGTWLHHGESPLSEADFKARLKLIQGSLDFEGQRSLTFGDGGMFWGHDVMLNIKPDGSFADPYLFG